MNGDDLNPERQNAINRSIDACDRQVVDNFARKQNESTEALVNTFTYFTMDDVKGAGMKQLNQNISIGSLTSKGTTQLSENNAKSAKEIKKEVDCVKLDEDGIEEEILDDGMKSGVMTTASKSTDVNHKPQRQFGNYVDEVESEDEGVDTEDVDTAEGYSASFTQTEKKAESNNRKDMSNPEHVRKMESLPHTTVKVPECELSALVDSHYEEGEEEDGEGQLNPGEVEEEIENPSLLNLERVTCLDITTTGGSLRETTVGDGSSCNETKCETDEVEVFKLDEDFDYDNVKLTPKFTQEELEYLKTFIPSDSHLTS